MTCDPHHSRFLAPNSTEEHTTPGPTNSTSVIKALDYYISDTYATEMFYSCSEVSNPSSNSLAMNTLCGPWGEECTPHRYEGFIEILIERQAFEEMEWFAFVDCWISWVSA